MIEHVLRQHVFSMKKKLGRFPYLHALIHDWYDTLFHPAQKFYQNNQMTIPFSQFYMRWTREHYRTLFSGDIEVTPERLEKTFRETLTKLVVR